ncbi:MAG: glycosyltransferase family 9 protein, partial [Methylomonas sp.]
LIERAEMVICPDTGVAHLAKLTNTPVVVLFGQGSDVLFGKGSFFKAHVFYKAVVVEDIHCRNQNFLFKRPVAWVRRCNRSIKECENAICMSQIDVDRVYQAALEYLEAKIFYNQNA